MPYGFPIAWIIAGLIGLLSPFYLRRFDRVTVIIALTSVSAILSGFNLLLPLWLVWISMVVTLAFILVLMTIAQLLYQAQNEDDMWGTILLISITIAFMLHGVLGNFRDYWWLCCH